MESGLKALRKPIVELTLLGRIPSKKNSRQLVVSQGRPFSFPSKAYQSKLPLYLKQIRKQYKGPTLDGPLTIATEIYDFNETWFTDWLEGQINKDPKGSDLDNRMGAIFDILSKAKVVRNDCLFMQSHETKYPGKKLPDGDYGAVIRIGQWLS
jgi:Holliday junction resolvase RusA-like endonuclease